MTKEYKILIIIAIVYIAVLLLFVSKFDFNLSATIGLSENHLAQYGGQIPTGIIVHKDDGFDGQYYYMMALNPTLGKIHIAPNFLQRILYPFLARILSFNFLPLLPIVFILINLASILISSYVLLLLLKKYNANLNLIFLWAFNVGFLISITRNLTEPLMMCLIALTIYFLEEDKHYFSASCLALAMLSRELALVIYAALLLYFLIKKDFKNLLIYTTSIVPFTVWEVVLILKTGTIPLILSSRALLKLPIGFLNYFKKLLPNINYWVVQPLHTNTSYSSADIQNINKIFSPLPILLFVLMQSVILVIYFLKDKKITKYGLLLLSQLALILFLRQKIFLGGEIDAVGRYALPMIFFSILYFAERGKKYNKLLSMLLIASSAFYFIQRFILPKGEFWITF